MASCKSAAAALAALGISAAGQPALAEVTAEEVWNNWKGYLSGAGYEIEATESRSGDTLTVSDIGMSIVVPDEGMFLTVKMSELAFTENTDGTVNIVVPPVLPVVVGIDAPGDEDDADITLDYVTTALDILVSGESGDMTYTYTADEVLLRLTDLVAAGQPVDLGQAEMAVADIAGTSKVTVGNLRNTVQSMTTGPVRFMLDMVDPESGGRVKMNGGFEDMKLAGTGATPLEMNPDNMAAMLNEGLAVDGTLDIGAGSTEFDIEDPTGPVQGSGSADGYAIRFAMSSDGMTYDTSAEGLKVAMSGGDLPQPIELAMPEAGFAFTMPVSPAEEEQDFALSITLGDFTMSELLWSMFDPQGQLPRDPATIALDIAGKAKLLTEIMDPEALLTADGDDNAPAELNALDLNSLTLRAAGAELTGSGSFSFDNSDLATFDGLPAPDGSVDLRLVGANGLLDKLIAMGLVPEDQAMGVRMMMGLFAVPGDGEDTLNSKIEVKPDGQILANGQRLR